MMRRERKMKTKYKSVDSSPRKDGHGRGERRDGNSDWRGENESDAGSWGCGCYDLWIYEIQVMLSKLVAKRLSPAVQKIEWLEMMIQPHPIDRVGWFQNGEGKMEKSMSSSPPVVVSPVIFSSSGARDTQELVSLVDAMLPCFMSL
jgi:hypothetical protein